MAPTSAAAALEAEPGMPEPAGRGQHLVFRVGEVSAALPLQDIREVVRRPDVLEVPLSPPAVEGLANLRGAVTVLINMRRVLGLPAATADEAARIIVLGGSARVGLQVDRIAGMIDVAPERIERPDDAGDGGFYSGTVSGGGDHPAISLLDLDRVLRRVTAGVARPVHAATTKTAAVVTHAAPVAADTRTLVSFEADGEEYAVPVSAVREIVRRETKIARMPHADGHMLGVITLRGRLLPLVELRTLLGLAHADRRDDSASRIIVLSFGGLEVGLLVDRAREILRVPSDQIDPVPVLFRQDSGEIEAICRLDQGRRLISILDPDRLFRSEAVRRTLITQEKGMADSPAVMQSSSETFVIFRLGNVEYGLPSSCVEQVVAVPERLTAIPKAPGFIEGVINHRGTVLPVIDQRRRFAMTGTARSRHIIVAALGAARAGLMVDAVTGVLKIPIEAVEPAPDLSLEQMALISRVANLGERMILLLDPAHLLARQEAAQIVDLDSPALDSPDIEVP
jgi:purine-binding chemotaxis protein CheW